MFSLKHCPFVFFYPGQGDNFSPKKKRCHPPFTLVHGGLVVEAGHRHDVSVRARVRFMEGCPAPQPLLPVAVDPPLDQGEELDSPARVVVADTKLDTVLAAFFGRVG